MKIAGVSKAQTSFDFAPRKRGAKGHQSLNSQQKKVRLAILTGLPPAMEAVTTAAGNMTNNPSMNMAGVNPDPHQRTRRRRLTARATVNPIRRRRKLTKKPLPAALRRATPAVRKGLNRAKF